MSQQKYPTHPPSGWVPTQWVGGNKLLRQWWCIVIFTIFWIVKKRCGFWVCITLCDSVIHWIFLASTFNILFIVAKLLDLALYWFFKTSSSDAIKFRNIFRLSTWQNEQKIMSVMKSCSQKNIEPSDVGVPVKLYMHDPNTSTSSGRQPPYLSVIEALRDLVRLTSPSKKIDCIGLTFQICFRSF